MTTANGNGRFRLVHDQGDETLVSEASLTLCEVMDHLEIEEQLHLITGWTIERHGEMLRCERGGTVRWIWPREEEEDNGREAHHAGR